MGGLGAPGCRERTYIMTEQKQKALELLDVLYMESDISTEHYEMLKGAVLEGPPLGGYDMRYTVFLIDGAFADEDADFLRVGGVDCAELGTLLQIAMRNDHDIVIRLGQPG